MSTQQTQLSGFKCPCSHPTTNADLVSLTTTGKCLYKDSSTWAQKPVPSNAAVRYNVGSGVHGASLSCFIPPKK